MTTAITIKAKARFQRGRHESKVLTLGEVEAPAPLDEGFPGWRGFWHWRIGSRR